MQERSDYELIDNFFPSIMFTKLKEILLPSDYTEGEQEKYMISWFYIPHPASKTRSSRYGEFNESQTKLNLTNKKSFYFTHLIYKNTILSSFLYDKITPHLKPLNIKSLMRIKINLFPNSGEKVQEHGMHTDYDFNHKAGILSINTCDGYTKLEDGTKIDSIANRMLLFDASKPHSSTTCTNQPVRMNINFNYF